MYLDASPQYAKNYFLSMFHPQFDLHKLFELSGIPISVLTTKIFVAQYTFA